MQMILSTSNNNNICQFSNIIFVEGMMIKVSNLFKYTSNDKVIKDVLFRIMPRRVGNTIVVSAYKNERICIYANEWLYLIKHYYPTAINVYISIVREYKLIQKVKNVVEIKDSLINFITTFSSGTAHGYAHLWYLIDQYMKLYKGMKILVYRKSQKGILDIIRHFVPESQIVYINDNVVYKIKQLILIEQCAQDMLKMHDSIYQLIKEHIATPLTVSISKILLCKTPSTENITGVGIHDLDYSLLKRRGQNKNYVYLNPTDYNEIDFLRKIHGCEYLICTWGTCFLKNYVYVSEKCKQIVVIVTKGYQHQHDNQLKIGTLVTKIRNAPIVYEIVPDNKTLDIVMAKL